MDLASNAGWRGAPYVAGDIHQSTGRRLAYLDGWRGVCILAVLIGHFSPVHSLEFGDLGVEMFFVLSGRLMADILFVEKFPLPTFYLRRFSRVWPGLAVYVLFCALVFAGPNPFLHVRPVDITAALLFLSNYRVEFFGQCQVLDHTWSLAVEEHSYLLLGLLAACLRNRSPWLVRFVILALCVGMALNGLAQTYIFPAHDLVLDNPAMGWHEYFDVYWRSDIHAASVMAAAFVYLTFRARGGCVLPRAVVISLGICGGLSFLAVLPEAVRFTVGTICLAVSVCALDTPSNPLRSFLSSRFLIMLGTWSYSIYIWQQVFYKLFQALRTFGVLTAMEGGLLRPFFILGACGAGILSYHLVEKPARRYINDRWAPGSPRRAATVPALRRQSRQEM